MSYLSTIFLAIGLAMDAFAVSITGGMVSDTVSFLYALRIALFFTFFQMIMPWMGWLLGNSTIMYIDSYANWVAFFLLFLIGIRMIYGSLQNQEKRQSINFNSLTVLFFLAIATSIDAFVSGLCISFLDLGILKIIIIIGIITLLFSLTGVVIGKILGYLLKKYAELAGGIILIVIAFQLLSGYIRGCRV